MSFESNDLVPLWDRPPAFLPRRPPGGIHRWELDRVRCELESAAADVTRSGAERRVALLTHPDLPPGVGTDGLNVGIQLLLAGESAAPHRHTPAALRVGLVGEAVTTVDGEDHPLTPLDVVLNPAGTWHGHRSEGEGPALWLDVVDLPIVAALGGVLFEPSVEESDGSLLDPGPDTPSTIRYPWADVEARLASTDPVNGVRALGYGPDEVLPTLAVTAHSVDDGAALTLPARTGGTVILGARGRFAGTVAVEALDVVTLRSWTPLDLTAIGASILITVDTGPGLRRLGLDRRAPTG